MQTMVVNRNGVDMTLSTGKYGKLSDLAGREFLYPIINEANLDDYITWYGRSDFIDDAQTSVRRDFADIMADHLEKHDGVIVPEDLLQEYQDFTSGRQSLAKVKEEIELLQDKQYEISTASDIDPETMVTQIRELNAKIKPLKEKRAKIEAEYQRRADKRAATKAANAARAAAAQAA